MPGVSAYLDPVSWRAAPFPQPQENQSAQTTRTVTVGKPKYSYSSGSSLLHLLHTCPQYIDPSHCTVLIDNFGKDILREYFAFRDIFRNILRNLLLSETHPQPAFVADGLLGEIPDSDDH